MYRRNHILVDGRTFTLQTKGGVSQLWAKILAEKSFWSGFSISLVLYPGSERNIHLAEMLNTVGLRLNIIHCPIPPSDNEKYAGEEYRNRREHLISEALVDDNVDIVLNTYYGENILRRCKNYLVVAHDFAHEDLEILANKPSTPGVLRRKTIAFEEACAIVNVSRETLQKGMRAYPVYKTKQNFVIYHGHDSTQINLPKVNNQILHVGSRGGYKNFERLLKAIEPLLQENTNVSFIIAGGEPPDTELSDLLVRFAPQALYTSGMSDAQMNTLMATSEVFVSSSLYEGFGIPVLNALRLNTLPVLSDIAIYREVAGPNGRYFDPENEEAITQALRDALSEDKSALNPHYRSWSQVGKEYATIIRKIANEHI